MRLATAGFDVTVGSRDELRARDVVETMSSVARGVIVGATNLTAANAEIVIVATPWDSTIETLKPLRDHLNGKVVISMVNALIRQGRELVPLIVPRGSMAAEIATVLPLAHVTGAFHHLPASSMEDLTIVLAADVMVVGDHAQSRTTTCELVNAIVGLRAVETGSLALAGAVESFTAVCISVNIRHKAHTYVH